MSDHPPAIPPIAVRVPVLCYEDGTPMERNDWTYIVPLGLSPEQPARIGGYDE